MKRLFVFSLLFLPLFAQMRGDLNEDMTINVLDVVQFVNIALGSEATEYELWAADVNSDENVDVLDVVQIVNFALGTGCFDGFYSCEDGCCYDSLSVQPGEWVDLHFPYFALNLRLFEPYLYICWASLDNRK